MSDQTAGQKLRERRDAMGLRQDQFAVIADVSPATVRRYETGKQDGGYAHLRIQRAMLRIMIERLVPSAESLAQHMGVTPELARRAIDGHDLGPTMTERALDALDDIAEGVAPSSEVRRIS